MDRGGAGVKCHLQIVRTEWALGLGEDSYRKEKVIRVVELASVSIYAYI